ncbi:MAG: glycosyltransferase family 4 protein [Puniceicoccaceae bacterium]
MRTTVFHSYGKWYLSGVNTWTVNLIRAMRETEFDSKVLFTGIPRQPQPELEESEIPYDFLEVSPPRKRRLEWSALKTYLEAHAPCIYITNFDFHRSCAVGTLSPEVRVVTVIHSDEECYFDELRRLGQNCNAIVCVSSYLTAKTKARFPHLADRVHFIPYGIPLPKGPIPPRSTEGPLRLCYCNRLQQYQKRIFDLPVIATELESLGLKYELEIAGDGSDMEPLKDRFDQAKLKCPIHFHGRIPNAAVFEIFNRSHLFFLTSDFEGLPLSLLEAMSVGCVPVVYQIESGIADAIPSAQHGIQVPHGDPGAFAAAVCRLARERSKLGSMAEAASTHLRERFSLESMAQSSHSLFEQVLDPAAPRPMRDGKIRVPLDLSMKYRLQQKWQRLLRRSDPNR